MLSVYQEAGNMAIIEQIEFEQAQKILSRRTLPAFAPGDTVRANLRVREGTRERVQAFEGVCIARKGGGINASFTVRKISHGEGVERVIPDFSPALESIEVLKRGKVRRAKLYYLRGLRAKAARIPERQVGIPAERPSTPASIDDKLRAIKTVDKGPRNEPIRGGGVEPRFDSSLIYPKSLSSERYQAMVSALTRLKALNDRAEGPHVRAAVAAALSELPDGNGFDLRTSELALHLGEYLCPLMFSSDEKVSATARDGVSKIGSLVSAVDATPSARIVEALASLELSAIITLDLDVAETEAKLGLTAGDVYREAVGETRRGRPSVHLQVLVEDMTKNEISAVAEFEVPTGERRMVSSTVNGDLKNKLITVIANGMEVFSARMNRKYHKIILC